MSWLRALSMLAVAVGLGCQNNTIILETDDPDSDGGAGTTGADTVGLDTVDPTVQTTAATTGVDSDGPAGPQTLLLAIDSVVQPGLPFQAIVTTTPGMGTIDLTLQFLSLDPGSTTSPRQLVGDLYAYPGLPVDASGTFYWDTGIILIPGAANPLTGSDMVVSMQANVVPVGTPAYCGELGGVVLMPIEVPLDGSTHAMTAVSDVANLPVDFPVSCAP